MPKVFISHSSVDNKFALKLAQDLKEAGIPVWLDVWEIKVGDMIVEKVEEAMAESDFLIVVISKASMNSRWVQEELSAAKTIEIGKRGIFILPALIESCKLPPLTASKRYADFRENYQNGLREILNVFNRTYIRESEASRYQTLEKDWHQKIDDIDKELRRIIKLEPGENKKEFYLTEHYKNENIENLRKDILDTLDIYRALRPLEKSSYLVSYLDGSAYFLAILGKDNDLQLEILQNSYPSMTDIALGVYLSIAVTQATCGLIEDSIWSFRKAIRLAMEIKEDWEDALYAITYQLSRYISYFHVVPEQDLAINLLLKDEKYLQVRYNKSIKLFRLALEKEMNWHLVQSPDDRVNYANLMEAVGFFKEALEYLNIAKTDYPAHKEFNERAIKINQLIEAVGSKGEKELQIDGLHKMPPLLSEFGQRVRLDHLIEQYESDFWKDVVLGLECVIDSDMVNRLFPQGSCG